MHGEGITYAYGFWGLVLINVALFVFFIISFFTPAKKREWRSMNLTVAFFVALFTEMYGFPLTIYILTAVMGKAPAIFRFVPDCCRNVDTVAHNYHFFNVSCDDIYLLSFG